MPRSWLQTRVEVPLESADVVGTLLVELGSPGLVSEDRGAQCELLAYFDDVAQVEAVRARLASLGAGTVVEVSPINEENWAENWKDHFPPVAIGSRLQLCPPWEPTAPPGRIAVVIDPGMAFGTGHHATTKACLELLEPYVTADTELLDVGTGSGVLSIAALLLGARRAVGVDTDPLALEAAVANAARNGVGARFSVHSSLEGIVGRFAVAVANIQLNVLAELEPRITALVAPDGVLIASGLLREELAAWRAIYGAHWIAGDTAGDAQWVAVAARRRPPADAELKAERGAPRR